MILFWMRPGTAIAAGVASVVIALLAVLILA